MAWFSSLCFLTKSSLASRTQAPPSEVGQHMARVKFSVTFLSLRTSSVVIEFLNCEYGFFDECWWFFAAMAATCSHLAPYFSQYSAAPLPKIWAAETRF